MGWVLWVLIAMWKISARGVVVQRADHIVCLLGATEADLQSLDAKTQRRKGARVVTSKASSPRSSSPGRARRLVTAQIDTTSPAALLVTFFTRLKKVTKETTPCSPPCS